MAYVLAQRRWTAPPMMILVFISYVVATPRGLFSLYLVGTGFIRFLAWYTGEPFGDPILSGHRLAVAPPAFGRARAIGIGTLGSRSKRSKNRIGGMTASGPASRT